MASSANPWKGAARIGSTSNRAISDLGELPEIGVEETPLETEVGELPLPPDFDQPCGLQLLDVMRDGGGADVLGLLKGAARQSLLGRGDLAKDAVATAIGKRARNQRELLVAQAVIDQASGCVEIFHEILDAYVSSKTAKFKPLGCRRVSRHTGRLHPRSASCALVSALTRILRIGAGRPAVPISKAPEPCRCYLQARCHCRGEDIIWRRDGLGQTAPVYGSSGSSEGMMETLAGISLVDVRKVYDGAEGDLWELVMGEQIHIGGFAASMDLAERAGIAKDSIGIDLCCCNGAGMRFLVRFKGVAHMTGVDATARVVERGQLRGEAEGFSDSIDFVVADATTSGLPADSADFVWGEDAWCYVENKDGLIREAVRLVRSGGTIAFTDWVVGSVPMGTGEADRFLRFMKFPNLLGINEYRDLLERSGCKVAAAEDTERFARHVDLYLDMLTMQLTYDALKKIGFDTGLMQALGAELTFVQQLAHEGKLCQGRFIATKQ